MSYPTNSFIIIIIKTHETPSPDQFREEPNGIWCKYRYLLIVRVLSNNYKQMTIKLLEPKVFNVKVLFYIIKKSRDRTNNEEKASYISKFILFCDLMLRHNSSQIIM